MVLCPASQVLAAVLGAGHKRQTAVTDVAIGGSLDSAEGGGVRLENEKDEDEDKEKDIVRH